MSTSSQKSEQTLSTLKQIRRACQIGINALLEDFSSAAQERDSNNSLVLKAILQEIIKSATESLSFYTPSNHNSDDLLTNKTQETNDLHIYTQIMNICIAEINQCKSIFQMLAT